MKKCWLIILLFVLLVGCSNKEEKPEVEESKPIIQEPNPSPSPEQNLEETATEIVQKLQELQILLGETELDELQNISKIDDQNYSLATDRRFTLEIVDGLVNSVTYKLQNPISTDYIKPNLK